MKISSIPKSGREDSVVYVNSRHGKVVREYVRPRNPRTPEQQGHRSKLRAVLRRWRTLSAEQRATWRTVAANKDFVTETGRRVRLNGYNFFVSLNTRRADLGLPSSTSRPPSRTSVRTRWPSWSLPTPVARSPSSSASPVHRPSTTLVQGASPRRTGVRCVQHFPFLGLLPPPTDGWSDITELYVARYGVPKAGTAIWIRTCQHIDGWTDIPKVTRARVPTAAA